MNLYEAMEQLRSMTVEDLYEPCAMYVVNMCQGYQIPDDLPIHLYYTHGFIVSLYEQQVMTFSFLYGDSIERIQEKLSQEVIWHPLLGLEEDFPMVCEDNNWQLMTVPEMQINSRYMCEELYAELNPTS